MKNTKTNKVSTKSTKLDKKNVADVEKKITKQKDLQYNYPKDASDLASRKKFRSACRRTIKSYVRKIEKASKKEAKAKLVKAHNKFVSSIHTNPATL